MKSLQSTIQRKSTFNTFNTNIWDFQMGRLLEYYILYWKNLLHCRKNNFNKLEILWNSFFRNSHLPNLFLSSSFDCDVLHNASQEVFKVLMILLTFSETPSQVTLSVHGIWIPTSARDFRLCDDLITDVSRHVKWKAGVETSWLPTKFTTTLKCKHKIRILQR